MLYAGRIPNSLLRITFDAGDVSAVFETDLDNGDELLPYPACQVWFRSGLRLLLDDNGRQVLDEVTAAMKGYAPEER